MNKHQKKQLNFQCLQNRQGPSTTSKGKSLGNCEASVKACAEGHSSKNIEMSGTWKRRSNLGGSKKKIDDQAWWPPLKCSMNPETCGQRRIPTWKRTLWPEVILANWSNLVWWFIPSIQIVILRMVYSFYHTNYYSWNIVHYGKKYTYIYIRWRFIPHFTWLSTIYTAAGRKRTPPKNMTNRQLGWRNSFPTVSGKS